MNCLELSCLESVSPSVFFLSKNSQAVSNLESWILKMEELLSSCEKWLGIEREAIKVFRFEVIGSVDGMVSKNYFLN